MWISRKISSILKQKSLLQQHSPSSIHYYHHNKKKDYYEEHISFVLAVISAVGNTGKSTLIQSFDLEEIIKHDDDSTIGKLYRLKNNEQCIIQIIEYNNEIIPPNIIDSLDGVFVCYDTTNRDSIDYLPDIINTFVSQHIPCLLIGLKSNLTLQRTVNPQLGHLIGNLFGIQAIETDTTTTTGIQLLQKYFIQFIYSDRKMLLLNQQQQQGLAVDHHHVTATSIEKKDDCIVPTSEEELSPNDERRHGIDDNNNNTSLVPILKLNNTSDKLCTYNNHNNNNNKKKNGSNTTATFMSRTSSCSTAATVTTATNNKGETITSIVDEVINNPQQDENMSIIFLTMFRKFMKPVELVQILIQRFESDLLTQKKGQCNTIINNCSNNELLLIPTSRQERIRSFFCLWLTQYWGDFKSSATRRIILQFLERISAYEQLACIYDVLLPLAIREPAICDKDSYWGMCDDDFDTTSKPSNKTTTKQQRKKDSGYCESFSDWLGHDLNHEKMITTTTTTTTIIPLPTTAPPITIKRKPTIKSTTSKLLSSSLRRGASTTSSQKNQQRIPVTFKSIVSLAASTSSSITNNSSSRTTATKHISSRRNSTPISTPPSPLQQNRHSTSSSYCPAIFGGGLISVIEQEYILVDPFEIVTSISATELAEQLTWIEGELFRKIQPRDFLRHLWNQKKKRRRSHNSDNNPVLASIEHFNFVSGWIASLVVNQTVLEKRVIVFEYCLKIAVELRHLNNFNTLMAVLAGVNSAAILRLKMTRESTKLRNKRLYEQFSELESLMSSERSFHNYRSTLKQAELPGIPYLGIHQQDLVSLGEANKDHKTDGKVHWKKFRLMGESILEMVRFQYPTYHLLEPNPYLLYFIGHESIPTEDERYEKSKEIEPRLLKPSASTSSSSTSSRWLTALK